MILRAPVPAPDRFWRITPKQEVPNEFVQYVLDLWSQGNDTKDIAKATFQSEAACERALHAGLESRRRVKEEEGDAGTGHA